VVEVGVETGGDKRNKDLDIAWLFARTLETMNDFVSDTLEGSLFDAPDSPKRATKSAELVSKLQSIPIKPLPPLLKKGEGTALDAKPPPPLPSAAAAAAAPAATLVKRSLHRSNGMNLGDVIALSLSLS
jgi:hypothetical protein